MFEIEKQENGKYKLYQLPGMVNKGNLKDEEIATRVKALLNLERPGRQLVSLSDETCDKVVELIKYYEDKGSPHLAYHDVINACVDAMHKQILVRQEV